MSDECLNNDRRRFSLNLDQTQLNGFLSTQGVVNFLNIPYARVPTRFRPATTLSLQNLPTNYVASQYGPRCPQKPDPLHSHMSHVFEAVSAYTVQDESSCLNLNLYIPPNVLGVPASTGIPVFVWIHGGGFNNGDNTTQFDGNHLVQRSLQVGKPIIVVTINYRLNVFGFISSKELEQDARAFGIAHAPNLGLQDQRAALQWVQSEISHFGGDPCRVTLGGESAGAVSVLCHVKAGQKLFQQVLMESPPAACLRSLDEAQAAFDRLVAMAGIPAHASGTEKLSSLRSLTSQELIDAFDGSLSFPIEDPTWFRGYTGDELRQDPAKFWSDFPTWCQKAVIGNTRDESALLLALSQDVPYEATIGFTKVLVPDATVPTHVSDRTCSARDLVSWSTQVSFIDPTIDIAKQASHSGASVFIYRLDCVDPTPGPFQGFSWHSFGIPFTFYQPPLRVYPELAAAQDHINAAFLDFFHGESPWEEYSTAKRMICWREDGTKMLDTFKHDMKMIKESNGFQSLWVYLANAFSSFLNAFWSVCRIRLGR